MMTRFAQLLLLALFLLPLGLTAQSPVGSWKAMIPDAEKEGNMIPMKVDITEDGQYLIDFGADGTVEIKGEYRLEKDQLTIQDKEGSDCMEAGVYKFEVDAKSLTMTRVSDGCANRSGPDGVMKMDRN
jgi:hypothetical protein